MYKQRKVNIISIFLFQKSTLNISLFLLNYYFFKKDEKNEVEYEKIKSNRKFL